MSRYHGKPFLRLLECYVLNAIGQLHEQHAEVLRQMEPMLAKTYGMGGAWDEIVAAQMNFPATLPDKIRGLWDRYLATAKARAASVDPEEFARVVIDDNFPDFVGE
jgi:hypothetical protein